MEFHDFSMNCGQPMGTVLISKHATSVDFAKKGLSVDTNIHVVVIYHEGRRPYLGSRVTKCCRGCKVYEHYGYWTKDEKRQFDDDCLEKGFLLLS